MIVESKPACFALLHPLPLTALLATWYTCRWRMHLGWRRGVTHCQTFHEARDWRFEITWGNSAKDEVNILWRLNSPRVSLCDTFSMLCKNVPGSTHTTRLLDESEAIHFFNRYAIPARLTLVEWNFSLSFEKVRNLTACVPRLLHWLLSSNGTPHSADSETVPPKLGRLPVHAALSSWLAKTRSLQTGLYHKNEP